MSAVILQKRKSKSAHLVAVASHRTLKECNQKWPVSIFFGLACYLLISNLETSNPTNPNFFGNLTFQENARNLLTTHESVILDRSWNCETHDKVMRLGESDFICIQQYYRLQSSCPKVILHAVMLPETTVMSPEIFS